MDNSFKDLVLATHKTENYTMDLWFKNLVFEPNKTEDYTMDLYMLPVDTNLRANNVKMTGESKNIWGKIKSHNSNEIYFILSRKFDIFFNVQSITHSEHIQKLELWYADGDKIRDIKFDEELNIPLYCFLYTPICIKATFTDNIDISVLSDIEMIYSAGLVQTKYRNEISYLY